MPSTRIESVEIVAPMELELMRLWIVVVHLDVVIENVPGHIGRVEAMAPTIERRRPEVHSKRLRLVHVANGCVVLMCTMSHFMPIDLE